jgi:CRP-like cAMP-binding protein
VRDFGLMSSITMAVALASDLFITPALMMTTNIITIWDLLYLKLGPDPQKQIPLFHGLRSVQAKIVVLMAKLASAERGAFITREGEVKAEMYVLLSGRAEVRRGGSSRNLRTLSRGDVIGEMGLVRRLPRSADVVAVEEVEYLVLDETFLQRIRGRYPRIGNTVLYNLTRILSDRLDTTTSRLAAAPSDATTVAATTPAAAIQD